MINIILNAVTIVIIIAHKCSLEFEHLYLCHRSKHEGTDPNHCEYPSLFMGKSCYFTKVKAKEIIKEKLFNVGGFPRAKLKEYQ